MAKNTMLIDGATYACDHGIARINGAIYRIDLGKNRIDGAAKTIDFIVRVRKKILNLKDDLNVSGAYQGSVVVSDKVYTESGRYEIPVGVLMKFSIKSPTHKPEIWFNNVRVKRGKPGKIIDYVITVGNFNYNVEVRYVNGLAQLKIVEVTA